MFDFRTAPPDALNATGSVQVMKKTVISLKIVNKTDYHEFKSIFD